jgi:RNA polymerase sigma factor (sigma-70 family)
VTPLLAQRPRSDRAFERLYQRHVHDVYRYALAVLRNPSDAEDVTQTTFMNAYRAFQRGERPRAAQNWLIAIAHNVCRQRFRQASRRPQEVEFAEELAEAPAEDDGPTAFEIQRALGHLAFNQRSALVMRELEGRTYNEIAEVLGLSVSAVETLIFRARRALREQLEDGLTCHEAERAISKQLDGRLSRSDRGPLRAHLRECAECATLARSQRAQRSAWKALGAVPLPSSLGSFFGSGGSVAVGTGVAAKTAAVVAAGALVGGTGYQIERHVPLGKANTPETRAARATAVERLLAAHTPVAAVRAARGPTRVAVEQPLRARHSGKAKAPRAHGQAAAAVEQGPAATAQGVAHGRESAPGQAKRAEEKQATPVDRVEKAVREPVPLGAAVTQPPSSVAPVQQADTTVEPALAQVEQAVAQTVQEAVKDVPPLPAPTAPTIPKVLTVPTVPDLPPPPPVPGLPK